MKFSDRAGAYAAQVHVAETKSRPWLWGVALGWVVLPFALRTAGLNPEDMIWGQYWAQGVPVPHAFTQQQVGVGFVEAVMALGVLLLLQLVMTVLFYRRAALDTGAKVATPVLWPLAALLPGVLGNALWYLSTGYFDWQGCLIGLTPTWLTFGAEVIVNRLGKNFVYGKGGIALEPWS
jgi:hypothetical protein